MSFILDCPKMKLSIEWRCATKIFKQRNEYHIIQILKRCAYYCLWELLLRFSPPFGIIRNVNFQEPARRLDTLYKLRVFLKNRTNRTDKNVTEDNTPTNWFMLLQRTWSFSSSMLYRHNWCEQLIAMLDQRGHVFWFSHMFTGRSSRTFLTNDPRNSDNTTKYVPNKFCIENLSIAFGIRFN